MRWLSAPLRRSWISAGVATTTVYLLFVAFPLIVMLVRGAGEDGFWASLTEGFVLDALRLSLATSGVAVLITGVLGTPAAYFLAKARFPGHRIVDGLLELPIVLPPAVAGLALLMAFGGTGPIGHIGGSIAFTTSAVVMAQVFVSAPFFIRSARVGFEAVDDELEGIAQTLGASPIISFWRVSLPLARRALITGLVIAWARAIAEFGATMMFAGSLQGRTQTMPIAILAALESDLGASLALASIMLLMALAVLLLVRWVTGKDDTDA